MSGEGVVDFCGHQITAKKNEVIEYIDQHIKSYILYEGDMKTAILNAIENDPSCILALVMSASFFLSRYDFSKADFYLKEASKQIHNANDRESMLYEATKAWRKGDMEKALKLHIECLEKFPKDLWNAKKTQLHAFNNGKKDQLLKVSNIVYDACKNEVHLLKYAHGMHLFALQENKYYQTVIDHLNEKLRNEPSQNNIDCWSVHAICHSLHGLGLIDEGIKWMEKWGDSWDNLSNFMYTHNWWHLSFLYVEKGDIKSALNIYDNKLMSRTKTVSVLVNALGLLLRMEVRKIDCGDRILNLLSYIEDKKFWHYDPFFDIFVVFCLSKCGKRHSIETFFKSLEERISQMQQFLDYKEESFDFFNCFCSNTWNNVVKPMAKAIDYYFKKEYEQSFEFSEKVIKEESYFNINASNEQIEVFIELFIDVLINLNKNKQAKDLIDKQTVGMKNITPYYKSLLEKIDVLV